MGHRGDRFVTDGRTDVRAVLFDCYGTLLRIATDRKVTGRCMALMRGTSGPSPMTSPVTLDGALAAGGVGDDVRRDIGRDLEAELLGVEPIGNAVDVVMAMQAEGVPVAIVSNLSIEYAAPIAMHLPGVPLVASFTTGWAKPDARIYDAALRRLGADPGTTVMIGDSRRCDHDGARAAGMRAILITRTTLPDIETASGVREAMEKLGTAMGRRR